MKKKTIGQLSKSFEENVHFEDKIEFWLARDIQILFDYKDWDNFSNVIQKAKTACEKSNQLIDSHFRDVTKMVGLGDGAQRTIPDIMLSRYACYLIAQNADPRKESVAFAQTYFAIQTRKQEILEQRIAEIERLQIRKKLTETEKELSATIYEHGVDDQGFSRIRSKGDEALFGGHTTLEMKKKLKIPEKRPLADFLPTITIKAKDFAGEITNFKVKQENLMGENEISNEHIKNNEDIRQLLVKRDIYPENLSAAEDVKKLERRLKKQTELTLENSTELPT